MHTRTDFPFEIEEHVDWRIELPDGTRLSARVWLPRAETPVPAILEYLPYRKRDGTAARDALTHPWFAGHGYACLRVDIRGNGESDGLMDDEYTETELADAEAVIAWIASQPWCSGAVGMMGISWGGFNALQLAARRPPALGAIITLCSTVDRYADDIHYKGGCLLNENLGWGATMWSYSSRPPDPALVGERWRAMWLERLEALPALSARWLSHPHRDAYWRHGSVCEHFSAIRAATLAIGGWGDAYKNAVPALLDNLEAPVAGITGPWMHKYPHFAVPEPRIGFLQEALRWWDHHLKGLDNGAGALPPRRLFVLDPAPPQASVTARDGRWVSTEGQNDPRLTTQRWVARADGALIEGVDPGSLPAMRVASPADCGRDSGEYCAIWLGPDLPGDQRQDDAKSLCFDSAPLDVDRVLIGRARVRLRLASDQPIAQLAVRLCAVDHDGVSSRLTYGVLNLCHRDSHAHPTALPVGDWVEAELKLDDMAVRVASGSRLRLALSNAYWPLLWPAPAAGALELDTVAIDIDELPIDALGEPPTFDPPEGASPQRLETRRSPSHRRDWLDENGIAHLEIEDDFGEAVDLDTGLCTGSIARERWSIRPDDPLSARGFAHWTQTLSRDDGWAVRTEGQLEMRARVDTFHLSATITAFEGDRKVFEKTASHTIPRNHL